MVDIKGANPQGLKQAREDCQAAIDRYYSTRYEAGRLVGDFLRKHAGQKFQAGELAKAVGLRPNEVQHWTEEAVGYVNKNRMRVEKRCVEIDDMGRPIPGTEFNLTCRRTFLWSSDR